MPVINDSPDNNSDDGKYNWQPGGRELNICQQDAA